MSYRVRVQNVTQHQRRSQNGRLTDTQMPAKWLAYALLEVERGFRRINHCADMKRLAEILER